MSAWQAFKAGFLLAQIELNEIVKAKDEIFSFFGFLSHLLLVAFLAAGLLVFVMWALN